MIRSILLLFICLQCLTGLSQSRYWVQFSDKGDISVYCPADLLSPKSLERREKAGISIDQKDFPVNPAYRHALVQLEVPIHTSSRWLNAVSVSAFPEDLKKIAALPFVKTIHPVWQGTTSATDRCDPADDLDSYRQQLSMVNIDDLHANGFTGKGVTIAVLDNGFKGVDTLSALRHIFDPAPPVSKDFVETGTGVYGDCQGSCTHGTGVLSIIASRLPGELAGSAPDATFILVRTENDISETHQEEDNWLAGAEFADSLGANIIVSSLSYQKFDVGEGDYISGDLDGNTAFVTIAADIAASKGILVVNSAGNRGSQGISPPADGDSVLAVGSVDQFGTLSSFSGVGPTADGRLKPDVVAIGERAFYLRSNGSVRQGNGTSYSCPIVAGLAACLMQGAEDNATSMDIFQAILASGDKADRPNNRFGHGLPNGITAYELLTGNKLREKPCTNDLVMDPMKVYPVPANGEQVWIGIFNEAHAYTGTFEVIDATGRVVVLLEETIQPEYNTFALPTSLLPGFYMIRFTDLDGKTYLKKAILR
ncbi:S8 family peptidase [bacterium]|nr:S8 family peptidase [bacterium]